MKRFFTIFILSAGIGFIIALLLSPQESNVKKYDVGATIYPIYDITRNIAGDTIEVGLLLPPGASPHTFEPSPSLIRNFSQAKTIYTIGLGFDDWVNPVISATTAENTALYHRLQINELKGSPDPHYWLSIPNAIVIANVITDDLSQRFPKFAEQFQINLAKYTVELESTNKTILKNLENLSNKNILTLHDSYYYFADEYGLNISGTFEPTAGREPTPQYLIELSKVIERTKVKTIYSEPQLGNVGLHSFAKDNNLEIIELDPIGGIENRDTFIQLMLFNANQIKKNN